MTQVHSRREVFGLGAKLAGAGTVLAVGGFNGTTPAYATPPLDDKILLAEPAFLRRLVDDKGYTSYLSRSRNYERVRGSIWNNNDSTGRSDELTSVAVQLDKGDSAGTFTVDRRVTYRYTGNWENSQTEIKYFLDINGIFRRSGHPISCTIEEVLQEDSDNSYIRGYGVYHLSSLGYNGHHIPLDFSGRADPTSPVYLALDLMSDLDRAARKGSLKIVKDKREDLLPMVEVEKKEEGKQ